MAEWLIVCLWTKWLWVQVQLQSLKLQISCLLQAKSSLTFRQLQSVDSLWNTYMTWQEHTVKCNIQISIHNTAQSFGKTVRSVWLNGWVFIYEISGCGLKSCCSHSNFRFHACFEQGVCWHSGNYRVWIHSETGMWYDKNIYSNALYREVFTIQLNHLENL